MFKYNILLLILFGGLFNSACKHKDQCDFDYCINSTGCFEGECQCLPGYSGTLCENFSKDRIYGNYNYGGCAGRGFENYTMTIERVVNQPSKILIKNFHTLGSVIEAELIENGENGGLKINILNRHYLNSSYDIKEGGIGIDEGSLLSTTQKIEFEVVIIRTDGLNDQERNCKFIVYRN